MSFASGALLFVDSSVLVEDLLLPASAASVIVDFVIKVVFRMTTCQQVIKDVENVILKKAARKPDDLVVILYY